MYRLAMPTQPALSNYYLGRTFKEMGNSENALPHLEAAAALGNPSAAYWAHAIYSDAGQTGEAQKFLLLAGELGHVYAQRDLARSSLSNASSIGAWMASLYKYFKVKATGVVLVLKNAEDPRVN